MVPRKSFYVYAIYVHTDRHRTDRSRWRAAIVSELDHDHDTRSIQCTGPDRSIVESVLYCAGDTAYDSDQGSTPLKRST